LIDSGHCPADIFWANDAQNTCISLPFANAHRKDLNIGHMKYKATCIGTA
jgi:hypothetical protein